MGTAIELPPFEFRVHLTDGQEILAEVNAEDFVKLRDNNPGFVMPAGMDPRSGAANMLFTLRMDIGEGFRGIRDTKGRNWVVPGRSISTFSYVDRSNKQEEVVGFRTAPNHE